MKKLDIEIYEEFGAGHWPQAKYLVHGYDDVLWTNDLESALQFMKESIEQIEEEKSKMIHAQKEGKKQ